MLKGFRDFIMRGNVIDLAVAVVIGAAFTALVTAITTNIINPVIASVGTSEFGFGVQLREGGGAETFVNIGAVVTAAIAFLITAVVVYFVFVLPVNSWRERRAAAQGSEPSEVGPTEVELLAEIRDLLRSRDTV
jgi:large conductance mechanosensitive channel